jgi:hypothetical protein
MYCRVKELKEAYKDTGLNLAYAFDKGGAEKMNPAAAQWFVYWFRRQKDSKVTLASVEGFEELELEEAVTSFFLQPTVTPPSMTGLPVSMSDSVGSDGASQTLTTPPLTNSQP